MCSAVHNVHYVNWSPAKVKNVFKASNICLRENIPPSIPTVLLQRNYLAEHAVLFILGIPKPPMSPPFFLQGWLRNSSFFVWQVKALSPFMKVMLDMMLSENAHRQEYQFSLTYTHPATFVWALFSQPEQHGSFSQLNIGSLRCCLLLFSPGEKIIQHCCKGRDGVPLSRDSRLVAETGCICCSDSRDRGGFVLRKPPGSQGDRKFWDHFRSLRPKPTHHQQNALHANYKESAGTGITSHLVYHHWPMLHAVMSR